MWWCILVLGYLQLQATTSTAAAQPLPGWGLVPPTSQLNDANDNSLQYRLQRFRLLVSQVEDSDSDTSASDTDPVDNPAVLSDTGFHTPGTKRAFTLLSRWHPFSTLSRNAPSIREQNEQILNDLDIETRAMMRPVGQPLRWG